MASSVHRYFQIFRTFFTPRASQFTLMASCWLGGLVACSAPPSSLPPAPLPSSTGTEEATQDSDRSGDRIVWLRPGDIDTLDPQRTANVFSWQIFAQVYDTLLAFDDAGQLQPHLATDWTVSEDGLGVTFTLRDGIQCHDGTVFDANDVKFTVDRALDVTRPSVTFSNWGPITAVTVVDPLTVTVEFAEPFSAFVPFMADPFASMLCDSGEEQGAMVDARHPIGTGPWRLVDWQRGEQLVLERNPAYGNGGQPVTNPGAPYMEQLVVKTEPNAYKRLAALERGEADVVVDPPIAELNAIQQNPERSLILAQNTGQSIFFQFNVHRPPFDDIRARQAIAHALNPEAAISQTWGNLVQREYCPVARGVLGNDPAFCQQKGYEYNPEKAKALLKEMGYGPDHPMQVQMLTWIGDQREAIAAVFQEQLRQVGIEAALDLMDISTLNARVKLENQRKTGPGTLDLMGWAWYDPDILYALWHSPGAYGGYTHPQLDTLLEQTRTTMDPNERLAAIQAVQAHLLEQAVVVPVYTPGWLWIYATNSDVSGFKVGPFSRPLFNDVMLSSDEM
ncbi:MAG: ABC transporter substrate-binding protein [Leptolyngbyaceae bacterium]|nr:ABC transporter substrate-binding protein [Leptolyngbyaceae bacterium]